VLTARLAFYHLVVILAPGYGVIIHYSFKVASLSQPDHQEILPICHWSETQEYKWDFLL